MEIALCLVTTVACTAHSLWIKLSSDWPDGERLRCLSCGLLYVYGVHCSFLQCAALVLPGNHVDTSIHCRKRDFHCWKLCWLQSWQWHACFVDLWPQSSGQTGQYIFMSGPDLLSVHSVASCLISLKQTSIPAFPLVNQCTRPV